MQQRLHGIQISGANLHSNSTQHHVEDHGEEIIRISFSDKKPQLPHAPIWQYEFSAAQNKTSSYSLYLAKEPASYILEINCQGRGTFTYSNTGIEVYWDAAGTGAKHYLHAIGLAFWFEQHKIPCIHANSLSLHGHGVGLAAKSQAGKSTLSAALINSGHTLLADDMLPLREENGHYPIFPGLPTLRIWPDTLRILTPENTFKNAPRIHKGFEKRAINTEPTSLTQRACQATPLTAIYLLNRVSDGSCSTPEVVTLTPKDALFSLLENSIIGSAPRAMGLEATRLKTLACLASLIPVKKLNYPSGFEQLDKACNLLEEDVHNLPIKKAAI